MTPPPWASQTATPSHSKHHAANSTYPHGSTAGATRLAVPSSSRSSMNPCPSTSLRSTPTAPSPNSPTTKNAPLASHSLPRRPNDVSAAEQPNRIRPWRSLRPASRLHQPLRHPRTNHRRNRILRRPQTGIKQTKIRTHQHLNRQRYKQSHHHRS